jgi:LacI family transcriptional regulator
LAGKGKISEEVRERVLQAAGTLGYQRRGARQEAPTDAPSTITILLPVDDEWSHVFHFIRPIIVEIERNLIRENFYPVVLPTFYSTEVANTISKILANEAKAVFSIHYGNDALFRQLEDMGIPVVLIMNNNFQDTLYSVCVDDFQGAYEGCLHLIRLGHRWIGYVDYHRPDLPAVVVDRFIGFKKAMDEYAIPFESDLRLTVRWDDRAALAQGMRRMFAGPRRPTALFVHDDYFAARVILELSEMGLRVPDDVSIIAPGDVLNFADPFVPQITTMRINTALMGQIAADMLLSRIRRNPDDIHVLKVKQQLVDRGSCRRMGPEAR